MSSSRKSKEEEQMLIGRNKIDIKTLAIIIPSPSPLPIPTKVIKNSINTIQLGMSQDSNVYGRNNKS